MSAAQGNCQFVGDHTLSPLFDPRTRLDGCLVIGAHVVGAIYCLSDAQGNFHGVKRMLLDKEDALVRGTGSFLVRDAVATTSIRKVDGFVLWPSDNVQGGIDEEDETIFLA